VHNGKESIAQLAKSVFGKSVEMSIPFETFNFPSNYDNIEFVVSVDEKSYEVERWPYQSSIVIPPQVKI
jgi:hypothetical protein